MAKKTTKKEEIKTDELLDKTPTTDQEEVELKSLEEHAPVVEEEIPSDEAMIEFLNTHDMENDRFPAETPVWERIEDISYQMSMLKSGLDYFGVKISESILENIYLNKLDLVIKRIA